jgi:hypothetical protein
MIKSITDYFSSFFEIKDKQIPSEKEWIEEKMFEWRTNLYSNNKYLNSIPNNKIIKKRDDLKKEYLKMYHTK